MWRAVQAGKTTGSKLVMSLEDDHDLAKAKPLRSVDDSAWIRKGYVVASFALLTLFVLSGLLTHLGRSLAPSAPNVLKYVTTFNAENFLDGFSSEAESEEEPLADLAEGLDSNPSNSTKQQSPAGCNETAAKLKVFMYDLPPEFHYGMMSDFAPESKKQTWPKNASAMPRYPGGLYQQHSPEYWLISDLLTSDMPDRSSPCTAFRVRKWQDADVILVPFFASLSYNKYSRPGIPGNKKLDKNQELQVKLLAFLQAQPAWRASNGEDHVVVIHHPNSMVYKREQFRSVMFVVADFGRIVAEVANMRKDVVAPYKHVIPNFDEDVESVASFESRPTLLFFQGAIVRKEGGIIREQLYELLREEPDVVFATGATTSAGIRSATAGMRGSKFCLHLAGDTPSSNRLFDAVASHCVPLIISDEIELPFEDVLDYSEFCLFVNSTDALRKGFVTALLRKFSSTKWTRMHHRMREVHHHFQYQHPSEMGDAVHMTWDAIARKVPALTLARNKRRRYARSQITPQLKGPGLL